MFKQIPAYPKYEMDIYGKVRNIKTKKLLKPHLNLGGYTRYELNRRPIRKRETTHRLMANTYLGLDLKSDLIVNHIDNDKLNNDLSNLEVCTYTQNSKVYHQYQKFGLMKPISEVLF